MRGRRNVSGHASGSPSSRMSARVMMLPARRESRTSSPPRSIRTSWPRMISGSPGGNPSNSRPTCRYFTWPWWSAPQMSTRCSHPRPDLSPRYGRPGRRYVRGPPALRRLLAPVAGVERPPERVELTAGVVQLVLPMDVRSLGGQQVGDGIPHRNPARAPGVDGPGWVQGHELEVDPATVLRVVLAVGVPRRHDLAQDVVQPRRGQEEVEEAGTGHVDALQVRRRGRLDRRLDLVGDLPGRPPRRLRYLHRDRARPVSLAVVRIAGLERDAV